MIVKRETGFDKVMKLLGFLFDILLVFLIESIKFLGDFICFLNGVVQGRGMKVLHSLISTRNNRKGK